VNSGEPGKPVPLFEQGFDFLGQNAKKYGGKLLIKPSQKNVKAAMKEDQGNRHEKQGGNTSCPHPST
jgi:hypothetical protein